LYSPVLVVTTCVAVFVSLLVTLTGALPTGAPLASVTSPVMLRC
jgi:hypothetical protein